MIPPGWNVTEPLELAVKLIRLVESLQSAPEDAKAFVSKINSFKLNVEDLHSILQGDISSQDHLRTTLLECQACVERCQHFVKDFQKLIKDDRKKTDGAGQALLWAWQEKKVAKLEREMDSQISRITFALAIKNYRQPSQGSFSAPSGLAPPLRSETLATLPPYPSSQSNWTQTESLRHGKTPADLLPHVTKPERKTSDAEIPIFNLEPGSGVGKKLSASPQSSPNALRPCTEQDERSELDSQGAMRALERRRNTTNEVAVSPSTFRLSSAVSEGSSAASRVFTSPTMSSGRSSITEATTTTSRRDSIFAPEFAVVEMTMEHLDGVQMSYYKERKKTSYPVSSIESCRNKQTGRRFIIITPPASSKIQFYFAPTTERVIAHSEHPQAYGGSTTKHKVKFIERYSLRSQRLPSGSRPSDASVDLSPSHGPAMSAGNVASPQSLGSPILTANNGVPREVSRCHEFDFEHRDDYQRFQELLMGSDVKLKLQVPVQLITAKKYDSRSSKESQLQYLRLWQSGGCQTLMFFANLSSNEYREYTMENFRPSESRSKTTIRLDVYLPGRVRRRSSSKSPIIIPRASLQEQVNSATYTDENDMAELDYFHG